MRNNERAAASLGISVFGAKLYAFAVGAAIAAFGGILLAFKDTTVVYGRYALLTPETGALGLATGGVMFAGAFVGRRILDRMSDRSFVVALEVLVAGLGVFFLVHPPR